jgi:predicted nucleotidyltransferase
MVRILSAMKYETYGEYDPRAVSQTHPAFLTVWSGLGSYHHDLVLLGGLVPHYICQHPTGDNVLPRPATLDVDFGVSLGASAGQYGSLSSDLRAQGFKSSEKHPHRFEKNLDGFVLYIDFLVEDGTQPRGTRMVDDVPASVMPGVVRALDTARVMTIEGKDLFGARQRVQARVCEVGPFLVLKLRALLHRQQGKDAFDILYTLKHYDGGMSAAAEAFAVEAKSNNPAFPDAVRALQTLFSAEEGPGPVKAAHFALGAPTLRESPDSRTRRMQVQQDAVSAALMLTKAIRP